MFLIPTSSCNLIRNDCKASSFRLICYLGSILELNLFPSSKNSIYFRISVKIFASCRLAMAIAVALFIGAKCTNIRWKLEEDVYALGIQSFLGFHFESWSKNRNSQFPTNLPSSEFQQHSSTSAKHISWAIDCMRVHEYHRKEEKVRYIFDI
jgi:hypothetical protein